MKRFLSAITIFFLSCLPAQAAVVGFSSNSLWFAAPNNVIEGQSVKVYANIVNGDYGRFEGDLEFYANDEAIGSLTHFNIDQEESRLFSTVWTAKPGEFRFTAKISNDVIYKDGKAQENIVINRYLSSNQELLFVDKDTDQDGIGDKSETAAGTDPSRADTDGDGYNDKEDTAPTNSHVFPGPDTDGDGVSDKVDPDIDNDNLYNDSEKSIGTDPYKYDTDGDGVSDKDDAYPLDPKQWKKPEIKPVVKPTTPAPVTSALIPNNASISPDLAVDTVEENSISAIVDISTDTPTTSVVVAAKSEFTDVERQDGAIEERLSDSRQLTNSLTKGWSLLFGSPLSSLLTIFLIISLLVSAISLVLWAKEKRRNGKG